MREQVAGDEVAGREKTVGLRVPEPPPEIRIAVRVAERERSSQQAVDVADVVAPADLHQQIGVGRGLRFGQDVPEDLGFAGALTAPEFSHTTSG